MIENRYKISNEKDYIRYNLFNISDELESILRDDYYLYASKDFKRDEEITALYKKNFYDKYDRKNNEKVYKTYIDNKKFKEKVLFIYSIIDSNKYENFVKTNDEIKNPSEYTIEYNILDSDGVKVQLFNISIIDISFVF